ncbi:L-histidine N(alpha)-methyltransferase [Thermodesulfobacteriota bacterium]
MADLLECPTENLDIVDCFGKQAEPSMVHDVTGGLTAKIKFIPSKYFYDDRGSRLFEEICKQPEYYPTRTEISLLKTTAPLVTEGFDNGDIVELGAGANWKIRALLDAMAPRRRANTRYVPVDVSESALLEASQELLCMYPEMSVKVLICDFTSDLNWLPSGRPKLILFLGSTIGNLDESEAVSFLRAVAGALEEGDRFLLGLDLVKPTNVLEAAYNDSRGVTAEFNKNILRVLNRRLEAGFDIDDFDHVAFYNEERQQVEMHLRAKRNVTVEIRRPAMSVHLEQGETIRTEISRKFTRESAESMVGDAGLEILRWFTDPKGWFAHAEIVPGRNF